MDRLTFRAKLTPASDFDPEDTGFVVTFPDWDFGVTQGEDETDALRMAADGLAEMVAGSINAGEDIPAPGKELGPGNEAGPGEHWVTIEPLLAAKAGLYLAMRAARVSRAELARRLGCDEKEVRRMLDPKQRSTRLPKLQQALAALGKRLVVEVRDAA